MHQLWKRIIFSIAISNTDDRPRNHVFLLCENGWRLSPAFDMNPSTHKLGMQLNIDEANNALDINLAKSVGEYFQLNNAEMNHIISEVFNSLNEWRNIASEIGISRNEIKVMEAAFYQEA